MLENNYLMFLKDPFLIRYTVGFFISPMNCSKARLCLKKYLLLQHYSSVTIHRVQKSFNTTVHLKSVLKVCLVTPAVAKLTKCRYTSISSLLSKNLNSYQIKIYRMYSRRIYTFQTNSN